MTPRKPWTCADTAMLRKLAARGLPMHHIGERMGRSASSVKRWAKREGIPVATPAPRSTWTPADDAVLRDLWPTQTAAEIGRRMGRKANAVNHRGNRLGLRKPEGFQRKHSTWRWQTGQCDASRATQFRAGEPAWNKGKRGSTGHHPNTHATQFKKGCKLGAAQHNYRPIGSLRVTKHGALERKVTDDPTIYPARRWVPVARLVWAAAHGPIPPRHVVAFKPGMHTTDEAAITADKLVCYSMHEHMRRNSIHTNYPPELRRVAQLRGALNRRLNAIAKGST